MRQLRRPDIRPPTLKVNGAGFRAAQRNFRRHQGTLRGSFTFPDHWNEPDVRGALYAMHGRVCAYCGCDLPRNDRGDVEHFRPKAQVEDDAEHGGYWWIAYEFGNYLLSCSLCNRNRKGVRFPLRSRARRVTYADRARLAREARLLLDPSVDPVDDWLGVDWRNEICRIQARQGLTRTERAQIDGVVELFRLNRDPELLRGRDAVRRRVLEALEVGQGDVATDLAIRYRPHSLVAFRMLEELSPEYIPTPEQEIQWLLQELFESLAVIQNLLAEETDDVLYRAASELLWSYAVLRYDPPAPGFRPKIEQFLVDHGIDGHVNALR